MHDVIQALESGKFDKAELIKDLSNAYKEGKAVIRESKEKLAEKGLEDILWAPNADIESTKADVLEENRAQLHTNGNTSQLRYKGPEENMAADEDVRISCCRR